MKNHTLCFLAALSFLMCIPRLQGQSEADRLDAMIREGMTDWNIPGLVTAVVKDGKVVFSRAYGVRDLESRAPVDDQTLFNMGSTTKAVVAIALGILVDRGALHWEDKVYEHLPAFELSDPYIREEARVRDLLTHNLGIAGADLLWTLDSTSTAGTIKRFALAEKAYPVRGGFQYNNLMYAVAGAVIEAVSGRHWTEFVQENIFDPLDMQRTVPRVADIFEAGNYVTPYLEIPGTGIKSAPYNRSDQIGAAGMIWTCLADIGNYLTMLTQGGVFRGNTLLRPETFDYLFQPHSFVDAGSFYPTRRLTQPNWMTYGLGWFQHDYRGLKLDFHTGSITGLIAIAGIIRERNTAVYVMANLDHAELRHAILYQAMDLWAFDDAPRDWHGEIFELYGGIQEAAAGREEQLEAERVPDTRPTLDPGAYTGNYSHPMLGRAEVRYGEDGLEVTFNEFATFHLDHWHYDTFRSDRNNRYLTRLMVLFTVGTDGKPEKLEAFGSEFTRTDP